jgi:hypothetical protein
VLVVAQPAMPSARVSKANGNNFFTIIVAADLHKPERL